MKTLTPQNSSSENAVRYGFAGHETFVFRYGWLKKGIDAVTEKPNIFLQENALVQLGVGKNMVSSIRYWGLATQLLEETTGRDIDTSAIGKKLLLEWDPFLEDIGSLWLIHWLLVNNSTWAAVWNLAFTGLVNPDFSKQELTDYCLKMAEINKVRAGESTISRDVDCFIRTYLAGRSSKGLLEDSFDCPLVELGLIQFLREGERYRFAVSEKPSLPVEVFGYALLEFMGRFGNERRSFSLQECVYGQASPGQVFKLTENAVVDYLERLTELKQGALVLDETEGLKQVYLQDNVDQLELLEQFYLGSKA
jgi:hypothetical protein